MNLTAAYAVELDVARALKFPGRRLRLLKHGTTRGYTVIAEVFKGWNLSQETAEDPLTIRVAELDPITLDNLRDTVAFAVNETVYEVSDAVEPEEDLSRIWSFVVSPNRKESVPFA